MDKHCSSSVVLYTLYRRPEEEGISNETCYSDLSNADLDRLVQEIKIMHPNDGEG